MITRRIVFVRGDEMKKSFVYAVVIILISTQSFADKELLKIDPYRVNGHLQKLSNFGKNPKGGVTRLAYTSEDKKGREYVMNLMKGAGMAVSIDAAGNLVGILSGENEDLKPIVMGSHIDTVPEGGNYDGNVGSMAAIEVVQTLHSAQFKNRHPIQVIIFQNEEGGHIGSRAITSGLEEKDLMLVSLSKKKVKDGISSIGGNPKKLSEAKLKEGEIAGYVELHVEQGGVLEKEKKQIGIVEGIVGIRRWTVTFEGAANHAGSTPMAMRKDALLAAARFIEGVNRVVTTMPGRQVATVGKIEVEPSAPNVIPGIARMTVETRDLSKEKLDAIQKRFFTDADKIATATKTKVKFEETYNTEPVLTDTNVQQLIKESATELQLSTFKLPSGAGHDAQEMAKVGKMGMIFIPSQNGVSHAPEEFTSPEDVTRGTNVLLHTVLKLDAQD